MNRQSPSKRRMRRFSSRLPPPPWHPSADPIGQAYLSRIAEMDIAFQQKIRRLKKLMPLFMLVRIEGGSGFRMANILRHFFLEYSTRFMQHGPYSLPTSFNVLEAFLKFDDEFMIFDLRQEREHLLRLHDYYDWYTGEHVIPDDPKILNDVISESIIYSYDLVGDTREYTISVDGSHLVITGVSLVRHENELSIIVLSGESPPYPLDEDIKTLKTFDPTKGHERISPAQDLSIQDRYLEGMRGFSKVILLTRFNLDTKTHDVRYINLDLGTSYIVYTDDLDTIGLSEERDTEIRESSLVGLERYKQLFSALVSLIYLPVMFVAEESRVVDSSFITKLGISSQKHNVQKAVKEFGKNALTKNRTVRCLTSTNTHNLIVVGRRVIDPPNFRFESTGFWKPIGANEIGEDRHGNSVMGKTWVERIDNYSVKSLEAFVIRNNPTVVLGSDPGIVYIMRTPAHGSDLYKVGLTRRNAQERAEDLSSSTGVPLPFGVLASWYVADCSTIEKEVHNRLKLYRVSKRREFFWASLAIIVAAVEDAITIVEGSSNRRGQV